MENQSSWTCDANNAIKISMIQPAEGKLNALSTFRPEFTYPIFGEEETIFGYKGLSIRLRYSAHDLRSNIHISYDERFKTVADVAPVDLLKTFGPWLPKSSFTSLEEFEKSLLNDESAKDFKPPGKLVHSYTSKQRYYEIWAGSLIDPEIRTILDRIQIFVSFFVEGGTPITTDDLEWTLQRWTVYFVYEKIDPPTPNAPSYSFVGFATTYRWYFYLPEPSNTKSHKVIDIPFPYAEEISIAQLPARLRIAQFLILHPHQQSGHGSQLYHTIHSACLADPTLHELTVEDPNEAFDYLRDRNDYKTLVPEFLKHKISINADPYPPDNEIGNNNSKDTETKKARRARRPRFMPTSSLIPTSTLHDLRIQYKLAPVQFAHIVEMYLLSQIPASHRGSGMGMGLGAGGTGTGSTLTARLLVQKWRAPNEHDRRYYWWRMLVKQRLYKRHRDLLIQLDRDERLGKLEETVGNVEEGYDGLLKAFEKRVAREGEGENGCLGGGEGGPVRERGKRKFIVFEDEDDGDGDGDGGGEAGAAEGGVENVRDASSTKKSKI
ncbi:histone acetyltransferase 1 [Blastomyces dermatitidis ER-3]|uniref:Histone acetyltransferase type B catalytic subunit n=1 Tax=Ajellomyces dermatitidis (strain ER-3 / ATCC MYA-2586) TaxID=559297 RepID=A0ABP2EU74_AJEDR|nr:histone acetyltransferase 1 [Blastomyces dermatitidis ER-3]EEQ87454.1 histone acetyltransferase 1 [Blastomyces dermatitidis ER-3]